MALSNWDTLAIDHEGKSTNGVFISPLGVQVEIYKNWLYVRDEKAWQEGGSYIEPTIMHINEGNLHYKDVDILAKRGPQKGIYVLVYSGWEHSNTFVAMAGSGVSGYQYPPSPCGHDANKLGSMSCYDPECKCDEEDHWHTYCEECNERIPAAEFVGTTPAAIKFLQEMLKGEIFDYEEKENHVYTKMANSLNNAKRFNQGDAFFAKSFGEEIPATTIDNPETPLMQTMIKGIKE